MKPRHFLDIRDLDPGTLRSIIDEGHAFKAGEAEAPHARGKTLAMIFEKPSTRTRVSFQLAIEQMGGRAVVLTGSEIQLGHGETVADTARVLSRYVDCLMLRTTKPSILQELADNAGVPVINGLTDVSHPCQIVADIMTIEEHRGPVTGKTVAWIGDANNVAASWMEAAIRLRFHLRLACPKELPPEPALLDWIEAEPRGTEFIHITHDPMEAASGADCIVTDAWASMHHKDVAERHRLLRPYQVNDRLMAAARDDAIFLHCLPAHRDEEVTASVIDGPQSVVFDETENRLHGQKGILAWCLT